MKREDCIMSFSEALDLYMDARARMAHFGAGGRNWQEAKEALEDAKAHMDALAPRHPEEDPPCSTG